jgi:von Willebrand factor type A domain
MSLHATTPETEALLRRQRRISFMTSSVISVLVVVLILLVFSIFLLAPMIHETPVFVTYESGLVDEPDKEQRKTPLSRERKPSAPSASRANVIAAQTVTATAVPTVDVAVGAPSLDFGTGDDFGDGWSTGDDFGGGGASFFNQKVKAQRLAYVIDYSQSMKGAPDKLMRAELGKSIAELGAGMQFQMIFFAGPVWVAGQEVTMSREKRAATVKDGARKYEWKSAGDAHSWEPDGKSQKPDWLSVSASTLRSASKHVHESPLVWGTIWDHPLEMALSMEPKPDIIFFMTDGAAGKESAEVAKKIGRKARGMNVIINTIAMMVPKAQEPLKDLAKRSGGQFTIVKEGGKVEVVPLD